MRVLSLHGKVYSFLKTTSIVLTLVVCLYIVPHEARSEEIVLQNDKLQEGEQGFLIFPFQVGDTVTSWLTSPEAGNITTIRIFWRSGDGTALPSQETSLAIHTAGIFPTPGSAIVTINAPVFFDGGFNDFILQTPIPVDENETVVVTLTLANTPADQLQGPGITSQSGDCIEGVYSSVDISANPSFNDLCTLGFPGNLVMRAVVDTGANQIPVASSWMLLSLAVMLLIAGTLISRLQRNKLILAHHEHIDMQ